MTPRYFFALLLAFVSATAGAQPGRTDLLILGSDHLAQVYRPEFPASDVLLPRRQSELAAVAAAALRYKPDLLLVEVLPEEQPALDSLYARYLRGTLNPDTLPDGRSEVYQLAFRMGKALGLPRIHAVNAPGGTSQSILDNGENIDLYRAEGLALRALVTERYNALRHDSLSLQDFYRFLNSPATYNQVYRLRYITAARVMHGTFRNPDAMVDTAFINPRYIGAELTSIYKNRDYKIYANILRAQRETGARRALLIIGVAHIGSLRGIFRDDEAFRLIGARKYLPR
ncbi:MAG: hypothetical protein EOO11_19620 [Chitinophagaceae bacterium]|nr:MAG: hypothetical protein EOO11_19620 [Chitinophagaceae bacterium]